MTCEMLVGLYEKILIQFNSAWYYQLNFFQFYENLALPVYDYFALKNYRANWNCTISAKLAVAGLLTILSIINYGTNGYW